MPENERGICFRIPKSTLVYCNWLWKKRFVHNARIYELANWGESYFGAFSAGPVKKCTLMLLCRWFGGSLLSSNEEDDDDNDVDGCPVDCWVCGATPPTWERCRELYYQRIMPMHLNWCKYFEHRTLRWQLEIDRTLKAKAVHFHSMPSPLTSWQGSANCPHSPLTSWWMLQNSLRYSRGQRCCTLCYGEDASAQETLSGWCQFQKTEPPKRKPIYIREHLTRVLIKRDLECVQAIFVFFVFSSSNT